MRAPSQKDLVTIAYAEDHVAVRKSIMTYLNKLGGIEVVAEANNGKELIEQIESRGALPDVCLIDLKMPVLNGFETVPILRQKWKDIKILVLSAFEEELYVVKMLRAGVNGYLSKSCEPEEIKKAILTINDEGRYYSELYLRHIALAAEHDRKQPAKFSEKERLFLIYSCSDLTYAEIARKMQCSLKSIEGYRDNLFKKLEVNSRISMVLYAIKSGLVPLENNPM